MIRQLDCYTILINNKKIQFKYSISNILEFRNLFVILIREKKEIPNNIIAYNDLGIEQWKINDIVQAKIPRGFDKIEKKFDNVLVAHSDIGFIIDVDIFTKQIIKKVYLR